MKETLRDRIASIKERLTTRRDQLIKNTKEYKEDEDFESAMVCSIKRKHFDMFITDLEIALKD